MASLQLFFSFLAQANREFFHGFSKYIGSYIAFVIIGLIGSIPWQGLGYEANSFYEIVTQITVGILSLIVMVNVILIQKSIVKNLDKEELVYAAPTYLIYTLYSTLIIVAGLFCFIVPGVIAAVFVGLVPLASVLIDNDSVNYFKLSYRMARKDLWLVICFGIATLLIELPSFAFDMIPDWRFKRTGNVVYSFLDAAIIIVLTVTSVKVFYHLKKALNDPS